MDSWHRGRHAPCRQQCLQAASPLICWCQNNREKSGVAPQHHVIDAVIDRDQSRWSDGGPLRRRFSLWCQLNLWLRQVRDRAISEFKANNPEKPPMPPTTALLCVAATELPINSSAFGLVDVNSCIGRNRSQTLSSPFPASWDSTHRIFSVQNRRSKILRPLLLNGEQTPQCLGIECCPRRLDRKFLRACAQEAISSLRGLQYQCPQSTATLSAAMPRADESQCSSFAQHLNDSLGGVTAHN